VIFIAKIGFQLDSTLPRDTITINPCYFGDDAQALANALKTNLTAVTEIGATTPFTVKVYNAQKAPPSYPLATASQGTGMIATNFPREVALCLSYYSTFNRPGYRGRVYIPGSFCGGAMGLRPTSTQMAKALAWTNTLGKGLPAGHNMVVYSRKQDQSFGVSNTFVDDEWDTVRSRGLRSTTRQLSSLP
jgi:hypothetical protein